jgi:hypothetical protein
MFYGLSIGLFVVGLSFGIKLFMYLCGGLLSFMPDEFYVRFGTISTIGWLLYG